MEIKTKKPTLIYCIGDSHVSFFSGKDFLQPPWPYPNLNILPCFKTFRLGPVLAYNLCQENTRTQGRKKLFKILKKLPKKSYVLLCFGEIDCRAHLSKQTKTLKKPLITVVKKCLERYFSVILAIKKLGFRVLVWGVIPSSIKKNAHHPQFPAYGTLKQRNKITKIFNQNLKKLCSQNQIAFISIFDQLIDKNNQTKTKHYQKDSVHLSQKAIPLALKELVKILPKIKNHNKPKSLFLQIPSYCLFLIGKIIYFFREKL